MLTDKVAVVTGGSRGIGRAVCLELAQAGAKVVFLYAGNEQTAQQTLAELGPQAKAYCCDVADSDAVAEVFRQILQDFGTVDILVNNAGVTRDKLVLGMKEEDFSRVLDVNLKGAYHMIRQADPVMMKKRSGKIINISSVSGLMGNAGQANYAASKAGLIGLTKSVAKELASRGVCCNAVAPGFVQTDMTTAFAENQKIVDAIPAKRFAKPEEVAHLVAFLASEKADYITGEVIRIDGGLAM